MTGVPTVQVLLDLDGDGIYETDFSARTSLSAGITVASVGRGDEFTSPSPSTLSLTLDNHDGFLTGAGVGWDESPWDSGPWGGSVLLAPGMGIRYIETIGTITRTRFTGRLDTLGQGWPGGIDTWSTITVNAVDSLAQLAKRPMRSLLEEEMLLNSPAAYYTLGETQGSTSAGDVSGSTAPPLIVTGSGHAVSFGDTIATAAEDSTAVTFAGGQFLMPSATEAGPVASFVCVFATTATPATNPAALVATDRIVARITTGGNLQVPNGNGIHTVLSPSAVTDGQPHVLVVTSDGTTDRVYLDGPLLDTMATVTVPASLDFVGGAPRSVTDPLLIGDTNAFTGSIAHVATFPTVLTAGQASAISAAALTGLAGETTDARLTRLASYVGMTATTLNPGGQLMGAQATSGASVLDALVAVENAEGGLLYVAGDGTLTLLGRYNTGLQTTPVVTVDGDYVDPATLFTYDTQQKINQVTVTRTGGASQVVSSPEVIADRNEPVYAQSLDLAVDTDTNALGHAQWVVGKYADTTPRLGSATLDLLTAPTSVAQALLALSVGAHIALTDLPGQLWANAGDVVTQGWSETLQVSGSSAAWTITHNLLPWKLFKVAVWDDPNSKWDDPDTVLGY